jgi:hypothetical protein
LNFILFLFILFLFYIYPIFTSREKFKYKIILPLI